MLRLLLALSLLVAASTTADAGPIRSRLAARKCSAPQQPRGLSFRPAPSSSSAASLVSGCPVGKCLLPLSNLPSGR